MHPSRSAVPGKSLATSSKQRRAAAPVMLGRNAIAAGNGRVDYTWQEGGWMGTCVDGALWLEEMNWS